jgi:hypothetical protein
MQEATSYNCFAYVWEKCSALERLLLQELALGEVTLFSKDTRGKLAKKLGICDLTIVLIQNAIRTLQRKRLVAPIPDRGIYYLDDFHLKNWLLDQAIGSQNNNSDFQVTYKTV